MTLTAIDWAVVALYFVATAVVGIWYSRRASASADEFFLSGRSIPWWLAVALIALAMMGGLRTLGGGAGGMWSNIASEVQNT